jgi:hypothetical protein
LIFSSPSQRQPPASSTENPIFPNVSGQKLDHSTFFRGLSSTQRSEVYATGFGFSFPVEKWPMKSTSMMKKIVCQMSQALICSGLVTASLAMAQAPAKVVGAISSINGSTLTIKSDTGDSRQVEVPATAVLKRIAPGEKDLSAAVAIQLSDLATGDRVLVKLDPNATAATAQALQIIAIKQADVAQKQQKDRDDWQRRGVGGLVKSVDTASGAIVLTTGAGAAAKTVTVHTSQATILKRYASASVRFDAAQAAPIDAIHAGDQLRARGAKNADGTEIAAEEVISGSFRNISGTVISTDAASSTLVVKDLATRKQVTVHIMPDGQLRRLPDRMAQALAARLKGTQSSAANAPAAAPGDPQSAGGQQHASSGQWAGQGAGQGSGDPQQMLSRAPAIQLTDLQKGEAVMLVSTDGTADVTAITLLAGVEPLLESPAASRDLLSNWSMGSGGADAAQ